MAWLGPSLGPALPEPCRVFNFRRDEADYLEERGRLKAKHVAAKADIFGISNHGWRPVGHFLTCTSIQSTSSYFEYKFVPVS